MVTLRLRLADAAAVKDERIGDDRPVIWWECRAQLLFNDRWVLSACDPEAIQNPQHVSVDWERGHAKSVAENDVRRLSPYPRQLHKITNRRGDVSRMPLDDDACHCGERPCLRPKEASGCDERFDLFRCCLGQGCCVGVADKEVRCHRVDPSVGALSRKDCGDEQLERVLKLEFREGVRMLGFESRHDSADPGGWFRGSGGRKASCGAQWIGSFLGSGGTMPLMPTCGEPSLKARRCSCNAEIRFGTN